MHFGIKKGKICFSDPQKKKNHFRNVIFVWKLYSSEWMHQIFESTLNTNGWNKWKESEEKQENQSWKCVRMSWSYCSPIIWNVYCLTIDISHCMENILGIKTACSVIQSSKESAVSWGSIECMIPQMAKASTEILHTTSCSVSRLSFSVFQNPV